MLNLQNIFDTIDMIDKQHLDIRTITMGISLLSCARSDPRQACDAIYDKITRCAENLVAIKMNAPAAHLDAILEMLPSLNSPTVSPLRDGRWLSVETVVEVGIVRDLIPRLREAGAEGIIEYALNKVI